MSHECISQLAYMSADSNKYVVNAWICKWLTERYTESATLSVLTWHLLSHSYRCKVSPLCISYRIIPIRYRETKTNVWEFNYWFSEMFFLVKIFTFSSIRNTMNIRSWRHMREPMKRLILKQIRILFTCSEIFYAIANKVVNRIV